MTSFYYFQESCAERNRLTNTRTGQGFYNRSVMTALSSRRQTRPLVQKRMRATLGLHPRAHAECDLLYARLSNNLITTAEWGSDGIY